MRCYVCKNSSIDRKMSRCPGCGFPVLRMAGRAGEEEQIQEMAAKYREKKLSQVQVGMTVYSYAMQNGMLEKSGEEDIILAAEPGKTPAGEIVWSEEPFARIDGGELMTLNIFVRDKEKQEAHQIRLTSPETTGLWRAGVEMTDGLSCRIVVGNEENCSRSEEISLVI